MNIENFKNHIAFINHSLIKNKINERHYFIGNKEECELQDDKLCLCFCNEKEWQVFSIERGEKGELSRHENFYNAIDDFFSRQVYPSKPWLYREEWEKKTGKKLSDDIESSINIQI